MPPAPSLLAVLRRGDRQLAAVVDRAAADAALVLGLRRLSTTIRSPAAGEPRVLPAGALLEPAPVVAWPSARLYRDTYHPGRLAALLDPGAGSATALLVDVALEPPPSWRYALFRRLPAGRVVLGLAPLDPRFWSDAGPGRLRRMRERLRALLVAVLGRQAGLRPCDEPGCWLDRGLDGVDALDAMEALGPAHRPHPAVGRRFAPGQGAAAADTWLAAPAASPGRHPPAFDRKPRHPLPLDVGWETGPSAALELFHAARAGDGSIRCERRHETPWAPTLRPPVDQVELPAAELARIDALLGNALAAASFRGINLPRPPRPGAARETPLERLRQAGARLHDLVFPLALERGLTRRGVLLALGIDEALLDLPFELMHDGDGFLCLKHHPGRFVNAARPAPRTLRAPIELPGRGPARLRALVVGAGRTPGQAPLEAAEEEARAAARALVRLGAHVRELLGPAATADAVYEALRPGPQILHFAGHADLGGDGGSGRLLLADGPLDADVFARLVGRRPPVLCVLDACESGRAPVPADAGRGRRLLEPLLAAGSYALAARWPVGDQAAAAFAHAFYGELLEGGRALGVAVSEGRRAARRAADEDDLTWAAYVLYGDPRIRLRRSG